MASPAYSGAAAHLSRPWSADRLGRVRAGPRRPGNLSGVVRRAARDRHPQPLTGVGREASKPRERPTGTRSAQTPEKRHRSGCGAFRETRSGRPGRSSRRSRVAHQPEDRCGGAIDRAILYPLNTTPAIIMAGIWRGHTSAIPRIQAAATVSVGCLVWNIQ